MRLGYFMWFGEVGGVEFIILFKVFLEVDQYLADHVNVCLQGLFQVIIDVMDNRQVKIALYH